MSTPAFSFSHMGMFVEDLARMRDFYTRVLGFTVTDRGDLETARGRLQFVFLSRDPREHHQVVMASGRPAELPFNPINQISFRMADFAGVREMYRRLQHEPVTEISPVSHGNALSVYFRDPEGNRLELFVDTPWYVKQPLRVPMDMKLSDRELWAWAEAEARKQPGFKPVEEWRSALSQQGMRVALAARDVAKLGALAQETAALALRCDATDAAQVDAAFAAVEKKWGVPDLVVYNASYRVRGPITEVEAKEVERTLAISAFAGFLVGQAAAKRMLARGSGAIFFTGASASVKGYANSAPFAMGKFALRDRKSV